MNLTLEQHTKAAQITEHANLICRYLGTGSNFEDDKVIVKASPGSASVSVKVPGDGETPASNLLVFDTTSAGGITTFRHTARWVTYLETKAGDAISARDAQVATQQENYGAMDDAIDSAVFGAGTPASEPAPEKDEVPQDLNANPAAAPVEAAPAAEPAAAPVEAAPPPARGANNSRRFPQSVPPPAPVSNPDATQVPENAGQQGSDSMAVREGVDVLPHLTPEGTLVNQ